MSKTAVVTGATSGIGAAYAKRLASEGCDLILTGRREPILQKLADDLSNAHNIRAKVIIAEFCNDAEVEKVAEAIRSAENLEYLINNAGYCLNSTCLGDMDISDCEKLIKVLTVAPVKLARAAVPVMIKQKRGAIVNVSSMAGLFPTPNLSIYCASKSFVKSFSEALYLELKDKGVKVQTLCPGFIGTDFYREMPEVRKRNIPGMPWMSPEAVVNASMKYLKTNRPVCVVGASYKAMNTIFSLLPRPVYHTFAGAKAPSSK